MTSSSEHRKKTILGVDPGLATFGLAVMGIRNGGPVIIELAVAHTAPSSRKRAVRSSDDVLRRARELHDALQNIVSRHQPACICAEAMSYPRSSSSAAKMSVSWGLIASLGLPVVQVSPQEIKRALCGRADASKTDIQEALMRRLGSWQFDRLEKSDIEHAADAAGAVLACWDAEIVRLVRRERR